MASSDSPAELVVENIVKEYATPAEPLRILSGVSFSLRRGENLAILGPSGSGRYTPAPSESKLSNQQVQALEEYKLERKKQRAGLDDDAQ